MYVCKCARDCALCVVRAVNNIQGIVGRGVQSDGDRRGPTLPLNRIGLSERRFWNFFLSFRWLASCNLIGSPFSRACELKSYCYDIFAFKANRRHFPSSRSFDCQNRHHHVPPHIHHTTSRMARVDRLSVRLPCRKRQFTPTASDRGYLRIVHMLHERTTHR